MLKIYGVPISRSISNIWCCLELGIPYDNVQTGWDDNSIYDPAFRKINPNARVPVIQDGDFILWESFAINLYLVKKYGGPMAPRDLQEDALCTQWSLWTAVHLQRTAMQWAFNTFILPEEERQPEIGQKMWKDLQPFLRVLDEQLAKAPDLLGDRYSVADLTVGCGLLRPRWQMDLSAYPNLKDWDRRVFERPAAQKAWAIRVAAAKVAKT